MSSVGFTAEGLSGSVALALSEPLIHATRPAETAGGLDDWSAELANQLVGRMKNLLLDCGITVQITLPVVVTGHRLEWFTPVCSLSKTHSLVSRSGALALRLEADISPRIEFAPDSARCGQRMGEGDLTLFSEFPK